jgi:hypothetical protein
MHQVIYIRASIETSRLFITNEVLLWLSLACGKEDDFSAVILLSLKPLTYKLSSLPPTKRLPSSFMLTPF